MNDDTIIKTYIHGYSYLEAGFDDQLQAWVNATGITRDKIHVVDDQKDAQLLVYPAHYADICLNQDEGNWTKTTVYYDYAGAGRYKYEKV